MKTIHKGRVALKTGKADLLTQAREGNRSLDAYATMLYLKQLSTRTKPIKKTGTVVDWLVPLLLKAWNSGDETFFQDIARTIKRNKSKPREDKLNADAAASALHLYLLQTPRDYWESKVFSANEIMDITGAKSQSTALRLARTAGLKIRGRGVH